LVRFAAVLMLLLIGAGLVACEIVSPASCELAGGAPSDGDACLCCCYHVIAEVPISFDPGVEAVALAEPPAPHSASVATPDIYHPPKV
jgi:hypothetical protein